MKTMLTPEQGLLVGSGAAAIAVVSWILWIGTGEWLLLCLALLFGLLFVTSALHETLDLPQAYGPVAMCLMLVLNLLAVWLYPYQVTLILAVVLAASVPYHLSARNSWRLMLLANVLFAAVLGLPGLSTGDLAGLLTLVALQGFAITSSLARCSEEQARLTLEARNQELQAARAVLARQSQAEERLRIAGALHDTIGHRLTALQLQLEALAHEAPQSLRPSVLSCKAVAAELLEDVRAIVRNMSNAADASLAEALQELMRTMPGVDLQVTADLPEVGGALAQQLVYCFKEGIHNAVRHGGADRIVIDYAEHCFCLEDNGRGLRGRPLRHGFGLYNMQQRLAPFGGSVSLGVARAGQGCRLALHLPPQDAQ